MEDREDILALEQSLLPLLDLEEVVGFQKFEALRAWLIRAVSDLIDRDFAHLLRVLYLIDVSEAKVRKLIEENEGEDAATIIADLILERQKEKMESRKKYKPKDGKYFSDE